MADSNLLNLTLQIIAILLSIYYSRNILTYERNIKRKTIIKFLRQKFDQIDDILKSMEAIQRNDLIFMIPIILMMIYSFYVGPRPTFEYKDSTVIVDFTVLGNYIQKLILSTLTITVLTSIFSIIFYVMTTKWKKIAWNNYLPYRVVTGIEISLIVLVLISISQYISIYLELSKYKLPLSSTMNFISVLGWISVYPALHTIFWKFTVQKDFKRTFRENNISRLKENPPKVLISTSSEILEGSIIDFLDDNSLVLSNTTIGKTIGNVLIPWNEVKWIKTIKKERQNNETPEDSETNSDENSQKGSRK